MTRDETIKFLVSSDEKGKFEDYIEENPEFDNLSRFFRSLAHQEIDGEDEVEIDQQDIIDAVDVAVADLTEEVSHLRERIAEVDSQVSEDDEIDKLAREIYGNLPESTEEEFRADSFDEIVMNYDTETIDEVQAVSTASTWADYFGVDVSQARRACARMQEYFIDVEYVHESFEGESGAEAALPERRWFKVNTDGSA